MGNPIRDYIGFRMIQALRAHRNRAEAAFTKLGLHTGQEWMLFQLWDEEGQTQSQLVANLCVEPPTVTKTLDRLERVGLVERRQDPDDARVSRVFLTAKGRDLEAEVRKIWEDLEALTTDGLSDAERALLRRLLSHIYHNLR
jgi:DNA-binding MarR family transcriptional regulator